MRIHTRPIPPLHPPPVHQPAETSGWSASDFAADPVKAAAACKRAADAGDPEAQFTLAQRLDQGHGIPENLTEARKYFGMAARQGHKLAWFSYAVCARLGKGGPVDMLEAAKYYKLSADLDGNTDAMLAYGLILQNGVPARVSIVQQGPTPNAAGGTRAITQPRRASEPRLISPNLRSPAETRAAETRMAARRASELLVNYRLIAVQVRNALDTAADCLARPATHSEKLTVRVANLAEASASLSDRIQALLTESSTIWLHLFEICLSAGLKIPTIEPTLTQGSLLQRHLLLLDQLDARVNELVDEEMNARQKIDQYRAMVVENQRISKEMRVRGGQMAQDTRELNPDLDSSVKARIQQDIERRARRGCQVLGDQGRSAQSSIMTPLIPNLAVQTTVCHVDPPKIDEVEETAKLTAAKNLSIDTSDGNAALQIMGAIAQRHNLNFALTPRPSADVMRDSWNKSADFAMENDVVNESSIILVGSTCPEHQFKGVTVHLRGNFDELEANPERKHSCVRDVRLRLAQAHDVHPNEIIILGVARGSICVPYTVRSGIHNIDTLRERFERVFGPEYIRHDLHHSFSHLQINPNTFAPQWNRDFRIPSMCPHGETRGGFPYAPPAGWHRFGMDVAGKYEGDEWIGMSNSPGEWAVVYHGTDYKHVKSITQSPLRAGPRRVHGHGIYCSPDPEMAAQYSDWFQCPQGTKCSYMFVCRVNVRGVHRCTQTPCSEDRNSRWTVHITKWKDIWFVNCENQSYQNIRTYGILVKECESNSN
jgi:hypothetical protein